MSYNYILGDLVLYKNDNTPFEVVGLRRNQIEIKGDFSGGTHNVEQSEWVIFEDIKHYTRIISAFPATGKTYFYNQNKDRCLDSDSSNFSWIVADNGKIRNADFPKNYIAHIKENLGKYQFILVSSHSEVREALYNEGIFFNLIYPNKYMKNEILSRMEKRGNDQNFIYLVSENWDKWRHECQKQKGCKQHVIVDEEYLSDILSSTIA